jgi:3-hydroxyacyl-CoA dehydrogenase
MEEKEALKTKICKVCFKEKTIKNFYKCTACVGGLLPRCKSCYLSKQTVKRVEEKKIKNTKYDDSLKLTGVQASDWKGTFEFLKSIGYDLNRNIAEQFAEKYSLNYKPRNVKERLGTRFTPKDFGLS